MSGHAEEGECFHACMLSHKSKKENVLLCPFMCMRMLLEGASETVVIHSVWFVISFNQPDVQKQVITSSTNEWHAGVHFMKQSHALRHAHTSNTLVQATYIQMTAALQHNCNTHTHTKLQ